MRGAFLTPLAKFLKLYLANNKFFVFTCPIIDALARLTDEFYEIIL